MTPLDRFRASLPVLFGSEALRPQDRFGGEGVRLKNVYPCPLPIADVASTLIFFIAGVCICPPMSATTHPIRMGRGMGRDAWDSASIAFPQ
jgi:hypothetical protein